MGNIIEVGQVLLAIAVFGYIFYLLAFSGKEEARREAHENVHRGFERREAERVERRIDNKGPPPPGEERRTSARRSYDDV